MRDRIEKRKAGSLLLRRGRGPGLLVAALLTGATLAQVTCAPPVTVGRAAPSAPASAADSVGEPSPEAASPRETSAAVEPGSGRFDPARPSETFRRRPPGTTLPDSVGALLARRLERRAAPPTVDRYLLYLPPGLGEAEGEWPLILYLHGRSLRGRDLDRVKRYGLPAFLDRGWDVPFVVAAPQLADGHWGDPERLVELVEELSGRYPIDEERIYLTGFSLGAGGVWEVLKGHAEPFAAAVPISAWTPDPTDRWVDAVAGLPLRLYHGTEDRPAPYARTLRMYDHLRAAGRPVELVTLSGEGHGIVQDVYRDPELYAWLLRQRKGSR